MPLLRNKSKALSRETRSSTTHRHLGSASPLKIYRLRANSNKKSCSKIKKEKKQNKDIAVSVVVNAPLSSLSPRKTRSKTIIKREKQSDLFISSDSLELSKPVKWRMESSKFSREEQQINKLQKISKKRSCSKSIGSKQTTFQTTMAKKFIETTNSGHNQQNSLSINLCDAQKIMTSYTTPDTSRLFYSNYSPRRTRSLYRQEIEGEYNGVTKCFKCHETHPVHTLRLCPHCKSKFHLGCLDLQHETVEYLEDLHNEWRCPRCIVCNKCGEYIADSDNVQCIFCARAWHGICRPKNTKPPQYPYHRWICNTCRGHATDHGNVIRSNSPKTTKNVLYNTKANEGSNKLNRRDELLLKGVLDNQYNNDELNTYVLQMRVLAEMGLNSKDPNNRNVRNQWIQFGQYVRFRSVYESAYREPINSAPVIYICEFCLTPLSVMDQFKSHVLYCPWRYPPGNEIYRTTREHWNIWEVEGCIETSYCRNLCLMAKLFLSSKTLYHEVETFTFYILTEITSRGCLMVGYFSKEKNPSKNNNLSCLLTLPSAQGKGYGKLLIDFSYQLSKREHKIGSPEHPLSDMGLLAYRSYWRTVLFCALRQRRNTQVVSLKDLSIETAINSYDIVSTLLANDMLQFRNDGHYIDINKALNASLAALRCRFIRPEQLYWLPSFEPNPYCKMNSYVSSG